MSAARAAGHCRSWEYALDMLDMAYSVHNNDMAPVVHTIMTNLKYNTNFNDKLKVVSTSSLLTFTY